VTGVSSIGLDHMQYLGDTKELIAREKAGIFKPDVPAVIGEPDVGIRRLLASLAYDVGATPVITIAEDRPVSEIVVSPAGTSFTLSGPGGARRLHTPLVGRPQALNAATAIAMLECAGGRYAEAAAAAERGLETVAIPGRFQRCGDVIFDVAHNPAGAAVLCETLLAVRPARPVVCLLTVLRDKDWRGVMSALATVVDRFVLSAPPSVPADRAWALDDAVAFARENDWAAEAYADFDAALAAARDGAATTLITGSFHTVGDAMARLQVSPFVA
jgi:dihydrofolate synthase/folylpolyglutamate synthase